MSQQNYPTQFDEDDAFSNGEASRVRHELGVDEDDDNVFYFDPDDYRQVDSDDDN